MTESTRQKPRQFDYIVIGIILALIVSIGGIVLLQNVDEERGANDPPLYRIVYLAPFDTLRSELYLTDIETGDTRRLTSTTDGVRDYTLSPDGEWVAYSTYHKENAYDIWMQHLDDERLIQLTNCAEALATCVQPSWSADGQYIAYARRELSAGFDSATDEHIWLVDVESRETRLLFPELDVTAHFPQWSPGDTKLSMLLKNDRQIMIYDTASSERFTIENSQNVSGFFSLDGRYFVYPRLASGAAGSTVYNHLEMVDLETLEQFSISGEDSTPVEDTLVAFHPDRSRFAVVRRYLDERLTRGSQIYMMDIDTLEATPLIIDPAYNHSDIQWHHEGEWLVMQRFQFADNMPDMVTEIWVYHLPSDTLKMIRENAYLPSFVPGGEN